MQRFRSPAKGPRDCGAPEIEVGECGAEVGHEGLDVRAATVRLMEGIVQEHVRVSNLVDNGEIDVLAPEFGEPANDDSLVVFFFAHGKVLS